MDIDLVLEIIINNHAENAYIQKNNNQTEITFLINLFILKKENNKSDDRSIWIAIYVGFYIHDNDNEKEKKDERDK